MSAAASKPRLLVQSDTSAAITAANNSRNGASAQNKNRLPAKSVRPNTDFDFSPVRCRPSRVPWYEAPP